MSTESMENALVAAFIDQNNLLDTLPVTEADFLNFKPKLAYQAAKGLWDSGQEFDLFLLASEVGKRTQAVGLDWFTGVYAQHGNASVIRADDYARELRDAVRKRSLLIELDEIRSKAAGLSADEIADRITSVAASAEFSPRQTKTAAKIVHDRIKSLESVGEVTGATGIPSGIPVLDEKLGGIQPGIVTLFAGRPAMGKSAVSLTIAKACADAGVGVHVFTLEDSEQSYADRIISRLARVESQAIRRGGVTRGVLESLTPLYSNRKKWLIDGNDPEGPEQLVRSVRAHARKNETRVVIIDYVQVVANALGGEERDAIKRCMQTFMLAAKRDNMAYVVLSQLNRQSEYRADRRPSLADMHGSGAIEQFSKCVIGLFREGYYLRTPADDKAFTEATGRDAEQAKRTIELIVLKNNNGSTGPVFANWKGEYCEIT